MQLIEKLESACIRFVHFSKENELRSRVCIFYCVFCWLIDLSIYSLSSISNKQIKTLVHIGGLNDRILCTDTPVSCFLLHIPACFI